MGRGIRDRRIWWWIGGALALAVVIFVAAALAAPHNPASRRETKLSASVRAEQLATQAQAALSEEETASALKLAEKALVLDSSNATAKRIVDRARTSSSSSSSSTTTSTTPKPASDVYGKPVKDVTTLLPVSVTSWKLVGMSAQGGEGLATFEPERASDAFRAATRAVFYVHDRGDAAKAAAFVDKVDKRSYPKGAATLKVGAVTGYRGNDGGDVEVFAFSRGRFAFELLFVSKGPSGTAADPFISRLAATFPASN